jgi:RNA polymerase sigma-70 factor (ECF subfamily)
VNSNKDNDTPAAQHHSSAKSTAPTDGKPSAFPSQQLIETTFLFCYKRMSDHEAARDLAGDIVYEAMRVLKLGVKIDNFTAWYWRMARNKYADYARTKVIRPLPIDEAATVESVYEEADRRLVSEEELASLAQALSRLAATHREIVVRYYLGQESVAQIARELNIPQGTVKGRLFDARKNLKERITTMEQKKRNSSAKQTYKPADLDPFFGGYAWQPICALGHTLAQQIAFVCRNEKKSVQEMSDEIEAPAVYLEDYLTSLVQAGVVKEVGASHYLTDFCIFPGDIYQEALKKKHALCLEQNIPQKIVASLLSVKDKIMSLDFYGNTLDYNYLLWTLCHVAAQQFGEKAMQHYYEEKTAASNDSSAPCTERLLPEQKKRWFHITAQYFQRATTKNDIKMKDTCWPNIRNNFSTPAYGQVCFHNCIESKPFFEQKHDCTDELNRSIWITAENVELLIELSELPDKKLTAHQEETVANFIKHGIVSKTEGSFRVNIPIFTSEVFEKQLKELIADAVKSIAYEFADSAGHEIEQLLLPYVRDDLKYVFATWDMTLFFSFEHEIYEYVIQNRIAAIPQNYNLSPAGLSLTMHEPDCTTQYS